MFHDELEVARIGEDCVSVERVSKRRDQRVVRRKQFTLSCVIGSLNHTLILQFRCLNFRGCVRRWSCESGHASEAVHSDKKRETAV